jgi:hypothetical protein
MCGQLGTRKACALLDQMKCHPGLVRGAGRKCTAFPIVGADKASGNMCERHYRCPRGDSFQPCLYLDQNEHVQVSCERAAESHIHLSDMNAIRDGRRGCAGYTLKCKVNWDGSASPS